MICPYCKNEMEKGYIQSRDGLGWNKKKQLVSAFSGWSAEQRLLPEQEAYRCKEC